MIYIVIASFIFAGCILYFSQYFHWYNRKPDRQKHVTYSSDGMLAQYNYFIPHTKERVMEILSHRNVKDKLYYEIDTEAGEIVFANLENEFYSGKAQGAKYQLEFVNHKDGCILHLQQLQRIIPRDASVVPWMLDEFWAVKAEAVPCDASESEKGE